MPDNRGCLRPELSYQGAHSIVRSVFNLPAFMEHLPCLGVKSHRSLARLGKISQYKWRRQWCQTKTVEPPGRMPTPTQRKEPVVEARGQDCGQEASEGQRGEAPRGGTQDNTQDRESHTCKQTHSEKTRQTLWLHETVVFFLFDLQRISTCLLKS